MMDFDISIEMGDHGAPELEIRLSLYPSIIEQIAAKVKEIDERYGPNRDVGPVTFILRDKEFVEVTIGTQKQGDVECFLDEFGTLVERS